MDYSLRPLDNNEVLGTSSPKKKGSKTGSKGDKKEKTKSIKGKKGSTLKIKQRKMNSESKNAGKDDNIALAEYSSDFSEYDIFNSSLLSPIRVEDKYEVDNDGIVDVDDVDNQNKVSQYSIESEKNIMSFDAEEEEESRVSSEAESTINKVKKFIESKRKGLEDRKEGSNNAVQQTSKNGSSKSSKNVLKKGKRVLNPHQKKVRKLVLEIHQYPYDNSKDWSSVEWKLFKEYIYEWFISKDDEMFQLIVLQDLFNCDLNELQLRINSLKKLFQIKKANK